MLNLQKLTTIKLIRAINRAKYNKFAKPFREGIMEKEVKNGEIMKKRKETESEMKERFIQ